MYYMVLSTNWPTNWLPMDDQLKLGVSARILNVDADEKVSWPKLRDISSVNASDEDKILDKQDNE